MYRKKLLTFLVCVITISFNSFEAFAQKKLAIGFDGGSTGIGGEIIYRLNDRLNVRAGYHTLNYNATGDYDEFEVGIDYDGTLETSNFSAFVDFYPFKKFFKLSLGAYSMNWEVNGTAIPNESYDFEERTFEPERLGTITTDVVYPEGIAPYLGFGFGNQVASGIPLKLILDIGMIRTGAPEISMTGTGLIAATADNQNNLQDGLNEFEWYPVVKLGLSFGFLNAK